MRSSWPHYFVASMQWILLLSLPQFLRPYWPAFISSVGEWRANVLGNVAVSAGTLLVLNLFFYMCYKMRFPSVEKYRISSKDWPWILSEKSSSAEKEAARTFDAVVRRGLGLAVLNLAISIPLGAFSFDNVKALGYSAAAETFPSAFVMALQLVAFIVIEDALFYTGHRLLHHPSIYAHVHKVHHAFTFSVSIAATATHPIEYIVSNVLPFVAGPTLLGAHCATIYLWTLYRTAETVFHHSGYDFPFMLFNLLPFQGSAVEHDLHHSINTGNFGSMFTVWDSLLGTKIVANSTAANSTAAKKLT
jgi:sterol desaturase/sphingolipid hydroxylase (fatty acid hydroxylase superfamily)